MRLAFFLLVLVNLLFLAWGQVSGEGMSGREPQRLAAQIQPEKLKVAPRLAASPTKEDCRRLGGLTPEAAEQVQKAVKEAGGGLTATLAAAPETSHYWVHIPVLPGKAAADKKVGELRLLGVTDFQVMQTDGPAGLAISLGVFATEEAATAFLQGLVKKGVRSARIEAKVEAPARAVVEVRGETELLARRLPELAGSEAEKAGACP